MPYLLEKVQAHVSYDQQRRPELLFLVGLPIVYDNHTGVLAVNPHEMRVREAHDVIAMPEKVSVDFIMRAGIERRQILRCSYQSEACKVLSAIGSAGSHYAVFTHDASLLP